MSILLCQNLILLGQTPRYHYLLKRWFLSQLAILVAYLPWVIVVLRQLFFLSQNRWSLELPDMVKRTILNVAYLYYTFLVGETISPWRFFLIIPLLVAFSLVLLIGLRRLVTDREKMLFVSWMLILPILTLLVTWVTVYTALSFAHFAVRLMFIVPVFYIVLATGIYQLSIGPKGSLGGSRTVWFRRGVVALLFFGWGLGLRNYYAQADFLNANYIVPWRQIVTDLQEHVTRGEVVVVVDEPAFDYYKQELNTIFIEGEIGEPVEQTVAEILKLAPSKIWLIARDRSEVSQTFSGIIGEWLHDNYTLVGSTGYLEEDQTGLFFKKTVLGREVAEYKVMIYEYQYQ